MEVDRSDLQKVYDALDACETHLVRRDEMNAALHLGTTRLSPLTTRVVNEKTRLENILKGDGAVGL